MHGIIIRDAMLTISDKYHQAVAMSKLSELERAEQALQQATDAKADGPTLKLKLTIRNRLANEFSELWEAFQSRIPASYQPSAPFRGANDTHDQKLKSKAQDLFETPQIDTPDIPDLLEDPGVYLDADKEIDTDQFYFTDKEGLLRRPTPEQMIRFETANLFNGFYKHIMESAVESGAPVSAKDADSFHRSIDIIARRRNDRFLGEHRRGAMMNSDKTFPAKVLEETVQFQKLAEKKLNQRIIKLYGDAPVADVDPDMSLPMKDFAPHRIQRIQMLKALGIESADLRPTLANLRTGLIAIQHNEVKRDEFIKHSNLSKEDQESLFNHIKSYTQATRDLHNIKDWTASIKQTRKDKGSAKVKAVRKHIKIVRYMREWNEKMAKLTPEDQEAMRLAVTEASVTQAMTGFRGVMDDKTKTELSDKIHASILGAYDQKHADLGSITTLADETKRLTVSTIEQIHKMNEFHFNRLALSASTSLSVYRSILTTPLELSLNGSYSLSSTSTLEENLSEMTMKDHKENIVEITAKVIKSSQEEIKKQLKNNDSDQIAVKANVAKACALASAIFTIAIKNGVRPSIANKLATAAGKAAYEGKAAVKQSILNKIYEYRLPLYKQKKLATECSESIDMVFAMHKNQTSLTQTRQAQVIKALEDLKIPAAVAKEIFSTSLIQDEKIEFTTNRIIESTNITANKIYNYLITELKGKGQIPKEIYEKIIRAYYETGFNSPPLDRKTVIINTFKQIIKDYNVQESKVINETISYIAQYLDSQIDGWKNPDLSQLEEPIKNHLSDRLSLKSPDENQIKTVSDAFTIITSEMVYEGVKAAAEEAGLDPNIAKNCAEKAKNALDQGKDKATAASEAIHEIPLSTENYLSIAAAISFLINNDDKNPADQEETNRQSVLNDLSSIYPQDRTAGTINIKASMKRALLSNIPLLDSIPLDDNQQDKFINAIALHYNRYGTISEAEYNQLTSRFDRPSSEKIWNQIRGTIIAHESIDFGKKVSGANPQMAELLAKVANVINVKKAVGMEIALNLAQRLAGPKPALIDQKTALEDINASVALINAKALAVNKAIDDLTDQKPAFTTKLKDHFLENGNISANAIKQIASERKVPLTLTKQQIDDIYNSLKAAADKAQVSPDDKDVIGVSFQQKLALAEAAVSFSNSKTDPIAAGSRVAGAFLRIPSAGADGKARDEQYATTLATIVAQSVSQRDGSKKTPPTSADPTQVAHAVGAARIALRTRESHFFDQGITVALAAVSVDAFREEEESLRNEDTRRTSAGKIAREVAAALTNDSIGKLALAVDLTPNDVRDALEEAVKQTAIPAARVVDADREDIAKAIGVSASTTWSIIYNSKANVTQELLNEAKRIAQEISAPASIIQGQAKVQEALQREINNSTLLQTLPQAAKDAILEAAAAGFSTGGICNDLNDPAQVPTDPLADWVATTAAKLAKDAGATGDEVKEVIAMAKEATGSLEIEGLTTQQVLEISVMAVEPLVKAGRMHTAKTISASLAYALEQTPGDKAHTAAQAAGLSQLTESERQMSSTPAGLDENLKKTNIGAFFSAQQEAAAIELLRQEKEGLRQEDLSTKPKSESFDHRSNVEGGSKLADAETWTISFECDPENGGTHSKTFEDWAENNPEFKESLDLLKACTVDGVNYANKDTLKTTLELFNTPWTKEKFDKYGIMPWEHINAKITSNGKGGIRVTMTNTGPGKTTKLFKIWAKIAQEERAQSQNIHRGSPRA